ncbi:GspH/FimT family protein [Mycoavidus sp. SF9855]|uniref:GspH/FimT family protein n=1 Tax=Mycoavidus sp. SF9855 TaxID=2968475 RepID=UPI00211C7836|nr:GspH/FimT family protein [Mycoavidus sp. SF9855]UUM21253.1 GspH/FimT family protein [Mycoavidus sp. SF9855]
MRYRYVIWPVNAGFMLLELLLVLSLLGAMAVAATPSVRNWLVRDHVEMQAQALLATLTYARSEAIRRAMRITVCRDDGYGRCSENHKQRAATELNNWASGYLVLAELPTHLEQRRGMQVLRIQAPIEAVTIQGASAPLSFTPPAGQVIGGFRSFEIAARTAAAGSGHVRVCRCVRIAAGGRSRIMNGSCVAANYAS